MLNVRYPSMFEVGGPPPVLRTVSIAVLVVGIAIWAWSIVLILTKVPRGELITTGPFAVVRHPLYTDVALLALPSVGFLLNTWLGAFLGVVLYVASRIFERDEDAELSGRFGSKWDAYRKNVAIGWL